MNLGLAGKRCLVTGSTRGIGRAVAEVLLDEGARVAIVARTDETVKAFSAELSTRFGRDHGGRLVVVDRSEAADEHHVSPEIVEGDLRNQGFEIISRDESFIGRPREDPWWLIVATKP